MATFYLLPPRPYLGQCVARSLQSLFPGLSWDAAVWEALADGLADAARRQDGVYVVYREELPPDEDTDRALADGFGAEPGDEVVEVRLAGPAADSQVRRWRIGQAA